MNNDLRKALELLRQARPRVEGMHLAQGCRADQGHIGLLREIDAFLASQQAEGAQGERVVQTAPERIYLIVGADCPRDADFSELAEVTWCEDDLDDGIEYVRADKARADLAQPSTKCPVCNDSGIMGHSDLCVACEPGDKKASPKCATCDDNGRIGGPSFYAPDEGGEPCPDCAQPSPAPERSMLSDPEAVLVNMMRGAIAKPSIRGMAKLYGPVINGEDAIQFELMKVRAERDAAQARVAEVTAELAAAKEELAKHEEAK